MQIDEIMSMIQNLNLKVAKMSEQITRIHYKVFQLGDQLNLIEDSIVNDDNMNDIEHRVSDIKEIVDATESKVYDLWIKKDENNV